MKTRLKIYQKCHTRKSLSVKNIPEFHDIYPNFPETLRKVPKMRKGCWSQGAAEDASQEGGALAEIREVPLPTDDVRFDCLSPCFL